MKWNSDLAYIVGLITTDGCLSKDGRHIDFTSKDLDQVQNFIRILKLKNKIGLKSSGCSDKKYYRVQFGNVKFYRFLREIGLSPNKSKILGILKIPEEYFADFLRGNLDGDGYTTSFWDKLFPNSFRFYIAFVSGSINYLEWMKSEIERIYGIKGKIQPRVRAFQLKYSKKAAITLVKDLYKREDSQCLQRKRSKIQLALGIINKQAGMLEW